MARRCAVIVDDASQEVLWKAPSSIYQSRSMMNPKGPRIDAFLIITESDKHQALFSLLLFLANEGFSRWTPLI